MTVERSGESALRKPLRLWPGVALAALLVLVRYTLPVVAPATSDIAVLAGLLGGFLIVLWWAFFSRAPWSERGLVLLIMAVAIAATLQLVHRSIRGGMMGMMLVVYGLPVFTLALVAWAALTRSLDTRRRLAALIATLVVICAGWTLVRTEGITGDGLAQLKWRWTETHEERLLAQTRNEPVAPLPSAATPAASEVPAAETVPDGAGPATPTPASTENAATAGASEAVKESGPIPPAPGLTARPAWPGFRGAHRDGVTRGGVRVNTNWSASPPVELWRRPIGPGWSSFAVRGDLLYTQEQRGEDEVVACYSAITGEPVWIHRDAARFWESNAGAGPRATPTLSGSRVYSLGATGILNALDAGTGAVIWSRNAASDTKKTVPYWGLSASPLIVGDLVIVHAGALAAYDRGTGTLKWSGKADSGSYSSPHLVTIGGVTQVVQLTDAGATSVSPDDGRVLWEHAWPGTTILQPTMTPDGDILISTGGGVGGAGLRRLSVSQGSGGWTVQDRWTSDGLKPFFNDYVVHKSHAYGFDGRILSCVDLKDGSRKWKGGRYGQGQMVLLPDQDLLLVLSEEGELALVAATPEKFTEIARSPALDGKTWNHPALVGDTLFVRNGEEMVAFRMPR
jgi:outer membrane protein assembly factor BamB